MAIELQTFTNHKLGTLRTINDDRDVLLEATPKLLYYDIVLQPDSLLTITEIAKGYGLSAKKLNRILCHEGIQFHQSSSWLLCAKFAEQGYTQSKTHKYDGGKTRTHMHWTQKGRIFIYAPLKNSWASCRSSSRTSSSDQHHGTA